MACVGLLETLTPSRLETGLAQLLAQSQSITGFCALHIRGPLELAVRLVEWGEALGRPDSRSLRELGSDLIEQLALSAAGDRSVKVPLFAADAGAWTPARGKKCPFLTRQELYRRRQSKLAQLRALEARARTPPPPTCSDGFFTHRKTSNDAASETLEDEEEIDIVSDASSVCHTPRALTGTQPVELYSERCLNPFQELDLADVNQIFVSNRRTLTGVLPAIACITLELLFKITHHSDRLVLISRICAAYASIGGGSAYIDWHFSHLSRSVFDEIANHLRLGFLAMRSPTRPMPAVCRVLSPMLDVLKGMRLGARTTLFDNSAGEQWGGGESLVGLKLRSMRRLIVSMSNLLREALLLGMVSNEVFKVSDLYRKSSRQADLEILNLCGFELCLLTESNMMPYIVGELMALQRLTGSSSSSELRRRALVIRACETSALSHFLSKTLRTVIEESSDEEENTIGTKRHSSTDETTPHKYQCVGDSGRRYDVKHVDLNNEDEDDNVSNVTNEDDWITPEETEFGTHHKHRSGEELLQYAKLPIALSEYLQSLFLDSRIRRK